MRSRGTAAALLLGAGATCCSSFHTSHLQGFKRRRRLGLRYGAHRSSAAVPGLDADSAQGGMAPAGVAVVEPELLLSPMAVVPSDDTNGDNISTTTPYASDLLFLHKPPGLLTLPGIGPDKADCLASRTNEWLRTTEEGRSRMAMVRAETDGEKKKRNKKKKKKPHVPRPCHRLDHDTSGVVVMALTPHAQRCGQMAFEGRRTDKTYVALVAGHVVDDEGAVEYAIGKVPDESGEYNRWACDCDVASGGDGEQVEHLQFIEGSLRAARTEWRVCARLEGEAESPSPSAAGGGAKYTRVELKLVTGRGHQLRLHMAAIGHPILGDELHAPREVADAAPRLCLHAETLRMPVLSDDHEVMWASATYPAPF